MSPSLEPARVCAVQMSPRLADRRGNLERVEAELRAAAEEGARLVVFPEAALTGYVFESFEEARDAAVAADGPEVERLGVVAAEADVWTVVGAIEREGTALYNAAFLIGPEGIVGRYRKVHTLCLGADRFTRPGPDGFRTFSLPFGRVGIHICYDGSFPESARALRLQGADLLLLPTNWPRLELKREVVRVRAYENHVFYLAVNRVGEERGVRFRGGSLAADPEGSLLLEAGDEPGRFHLEMELWRARQTREVVEAGEYELDLMADRRPSAYAAIAHPRPDALPTGSAGSR